MYKTKSFMTKDVLTVTEDSSLLSAYKIMYEKRIRHLPVIDKNQVVIGMLSDRDIQRAMVVDRTGGEINEEVYLNAKKKVSDFMSVIVFSVLSGTSLNTVIEEMMTKKISAVVVVDEESRCVGIVTSNDIMRVFLGVLGRNHELLEKPMSFFLSNTLY